jgi:poly-gamma-glutamate capsule biosynthesis protein CapA/YwtB (metallophosphatase superfamily)
LRAALLRIALYLTAVLALSGCERRSEAAEETKARDAPASTLPSITPDSGTTQEAKAEAKAEHLVVLFGGDVNLGRGAGQKIIADPSYDPFVHIRPLLATADLRMANLESQLSEQGGETQSARNHLVFTGPPGGAGVLSRAGFQAVSFANNHAWDYGKSGFLQTLDALDGAGVAHVGASREVGRAYEPVILNVKGWKVAVFAVTHIWNQGPIQDHEGRHYVAWAAYDRLQKQVKKARLENDLVLVSYHGGGEYMDVPMQWTREFVRAAMAGGVDAFFGHHPHVPLGVGWQKDKPIFYSLGNLVFAMHSDYPWTGTSFMARVTFHADGRLEAEACPYHILGHQPMPFEGKTKEARERAFVQHLGLVSVATGGTRIGEPGEGSCVALSPPQPKGKR